MKRRAVRVTLVLALLAVAAAAVHQAVTREQAVTAAAAAKASFTGSVVRADAALAEIAASQRAYVAPGQGLDFWAKRTDEALGAAREALSAVRAAAGDPRAAAEAESALARLDDFSAADRHARDYVRGGQRTMAADLIFADGYETVAAARAELASALSIERASLEAAPPRDRAIFLASLGLLAACVLVAAVLLIRGPKAVEPAATPIEASPFAPAAQAALPDDGIGAALDASLESLDTPFAPEPTEPVDLPTAADICVDLARLLDARDLQAMIARVADVLHASGVIVWMADGGGAVLAPALTHGYPSSLVARLGPLPVGDDNATAAAWRAKAMQVVEGALAVPLVTSSGCTGVLALELGEGRERASDVQSLARIVAAQLAAIVSPPAAAAPRAAEA